MIGERRADDDTTWPLPNGAYWRIRQLVEPFAMVWYATTPNGMLANLTNHTIVEHDDGTITVSPSILVTRYDGSRWHGYLEHGIWREC